jgi:hypothetical protein
MAMKRRAVSNQECFSVYGFLPTNMVLRCIYHAYSPHTKRVKGKGTVHPRTGHEGPEGEYRYSSTLTLTSALDGVGGQRHAPAALPPGKRAGIHCTGGWVGPQGRYEWGRIISPPSGFDPRYLPARSESLYRLSYPGATKTVRKGYFRP